MGVFTPLLVYNSHMDSQELFNFREPIDPAQLWCVWFWLPHIPKNSEFSGWRARTWVLARAGDPGLTDVIHSRGFDENDVIAALPLPKLQDALELIKLAQSSTTLGKLVSPFISSGVSIVRLGDGTMETIPTSQVGSSGSTVLLNGKMEDLKTDVDEGLRIIREKDYTDIMEDLRPQENRVEDWLLIQRDPENYEKNKPLLYPERYPAHQVELTTKRID